MNMQAKYFDEQPTMMNCAMNFGLIVGGYYIVKFCLFPLALHSTFVSMVFLGLTAVVPFLIYMLVKWIIGVFSCLCVFGPYDGLWLLACCCGSLYLFCIH